MKAGDFVYIEATTGNGKSPYDEWSHHDIKGIYEFVKKTRTRIWLREGDLVIKIYKSRITKIEIRDKSGNI